MNKVRIGGVPEHFNMPWHVGMEKGDFSKIDVDLHWTDYDTGTGQMIKDLDANKIDMAVLLTEGAIAGIAKGSKYKIIGYFVESPLFWGIHTPNSSSLEPEQLQGETFAVSRYGSGSHLMAIVHQMQNGHDPENISYELVGNMPGAAKSFEEESSSVFLWEKYTTEVMVNKGAMKRIGVCPTPWPCFVIVVSDEFEQSNPGLAQQIGEAVWQVNKQFESKADWIAPISKKYGLSEAKITEWISDVQWSTGEKPTQSTIDLVCSYLQKAGVIEQKPLLEKTLI